MHYLASPTENKGFKRQFLKLFETLTARVLNIPELFKFSL